MFKLTSYLQKFTEFLSEYLTDMWLFIQHNNYSPVENKSLQKFFRLIIQTHTIEKGLSLPNPRPMFGQEKIKNILAEANDYEREFSNFPLGMLHGALSEYYEFNQANVGTSLLQDISNQINFETSLNTPKTGGKKILSDTTFTLSEQQNIRKFLKSRFSCRNFKTETLPIDQILCAIEIAQKAPSQCNRQSTRVHLFQKNNKIQELLQLQAGSAGFSECVNNLFIVTSVITAWGGPQQRNQMYVDGALYSMMLMLGLYSQGIASCPLNLALTNSVERKLKICGNIPENERLIMMIAFGDMLDDKISIASSPRLDVESILTNHFE